MRRSFLALAGVALCALASFGNATAPEQPLPADDNLRQLLKSRFDAAARELAARKELYRAGRVSLDDTCDAIGRFATASVESAETPAERVKQCEAAFEIAKFVEEVVKDKFENSVEPMQAMALATYTRLDMEIKLNLARKAAKVQR